MEVSKIDGDSQSRSDQEGKRAGSDVGAPSASTFSMLRNQRKTKYLNENAKQEQK
jgi:hypothetical protein